MEGPLDMSLRETFDKAWSDVTSRARCVVQEKEELFALAALMQAHGVQSYLELGASEGVSLGVLGRCLPNGSLIHAVDLCEPHSVGLLAMNVNDLREWHHATSFKMTTEEYHAKQDSQWDTPDSWDAILIDAGHTYEDVRVDWEMYKNCGKMIIFHDIRHDGVRDVWQQVKSQYPTVEIHAGKYTVYGGEKMGFGVVLNG
jgi:predicted O-methyltransferase YrrM